MARNTELVRQWDILRAIDSARTGISIGKLAAMRRVHQRTIRRDLNALDRAGFAVYDEKVNGTMWKLRARPFRGLQRLGLSVMELAALYLGRSVLIAAGAAPFADEMDRAFDKIQAAIPDGVRHFLDRLRVMIKTKLTGARKHDARKMREILQRITAHRSSGGASR